MSAPLEPSRTTTEFLSSLKDKQDGLAWLEFERRHGAGIRRIACKFGLADDEIDDAVQETMLQFVRDYGDGHYDRTRGRLTSWVMGIARHRVLDVMRQRERGGKPTTEEPAVDVFEARWEAEERQFLLREALASLQNSSHFAPRTLEAFRLCTLEGVDAGSTAKRLGMSRAHVYVAKHECLARLRSWLAEAPEWL